MAINRGTCKPPSAPTRHRYVAITDTVNVKSSLILDVAAAATTARRHLSTTISLLLLLLLLLLVLGLLLPVFTQQVKCYKTVRDIYESPTFKYKLKLRLYNWYVCVTDFTKIHLQSLSELFVLNNLIQQHTLQLLDTANNVTGLPWTLVHACEA